MLGWHLHWTTLQPQQEEFRTGLGMACNDTTKETQLENSMAEVGFFNHAYLDHNYYSIEEWRSIDEYPSYGGTPTRGVGPIMLGMNPAGADVGEPPHKSFSMMMKGLGLPGTHKASGHLSDADELQAPICMT
ncbi:hypothetical protein GOP47_0005476 [Adiantum capillus-veneris]|uniref:Uncharacterized protein n=1 Tax=Adiantum capillus-veneris TaxID=13818 RepID=A0A9D4V5W3_ADICA|nr:hypothetical protein GOP47_0005476 [Adiantum capillus-veneris]